MKDSGGKIRRVTYYAGHVQGVGFRYSACRVAERFDVTGYVKNLHDGRVEVLAEGDEKEVEAFFEGVWRRMGQYVRETTGYDAPATGQYSTFEVAYF